MNVAVQERPIARDSHEHFSDSWPNSQARVTEQFAEAGIPGAEKRRTVDENGQRVFGLDL